jgi:hypothetical protein
MSETKTDEPDGGREQPFETDEDVSDHLSELTDGCGCVEIWERLSEARNTD